MVRIEWTIQLRAARRPPAKPNIKPTDAFSIQSPASSSRARAGVISASVTGASHTITYAHQTYRKQADEHPLYWDFITFSTRVKVHIKIRCFNPQA